MALGIRLHKHPSGFAPFEQTFTYTGAVQTLLIPKKGLYQLEVWGSKGGYSSGGYGGYSKGYALLNKDTLLYICCGGVPYNGGGTGAGYDSNVGNGGGATHIAYVDGILRNIGYASFVTNQNGLIAAGGGGGGAAFWAGGSVSGGTGGGTGGGSGTNGGKGFHGTGGSQSYAGTAYGTSQCAGGFGYGGNGTGDSFREWAGGGGGGLYGGGGALQDSSKSDRSAGGGGGSGWIGGVPEIVYKGKTYTPSTENGVNNSTGIAKITRVA